MVIDSRPAANRKVLSYFDSVPYTCYELGHTWEPRCAATCLFSLKDSLKNSLKVYLPFYMIELLIKMKKKEYRNKKSLRKALIKTVRSSAFLCANGTMAIGGFCLLRHIMGKFYGWHSFVVGIGVGHLAISFENKSRRNMVVLYTAVVAAETFFRMLAFRGILQPLPGGEVVLFSMASAAFMALYRTPGGLPRNTQYFISALLSREEGNVDDVASGAAITSLWKFIGEKAPLHQKLLQRFRSCHASHSCCPHRYSCISYATEGFLQSFLLGYFANIGINIVQAMQKRKSVIGLLRNFPLAIFFGGYSLLFRACNCLLRWLRNEDSPLMHGAIAGAAAGITSWFYKSSTLSLYLMFKIVEILSHKRKLPHFKHAGRHLYALSVAIILHAAYLEPHNIRPVFWNFICEISSGKFPLLFRKLLDVYGTHASTLYPNFVPELQQKFVKSAEVSRICSVSGKLL